jgi:hypothetical protein
MVYIDYYIIELLEIACLKENECENDWVIQY